MVADLIASSARDYGALLSSLTTGRRASQAGAGAAAAGVSHERRVSRVCGELGDALLDFLRLAFVGHEGGVAGLDDDGDNDLFPAARSGASFKVWWNRRCRG